MKTTLKEIKKHVKSVITKHKEPKTISICLGRLTDSQKKSIETDLKYKLIPEYFGYWRFEKI